MLRLGDQTDLDFECESQIHDETTVAIAKPLSSQQTFRGGMIKALSSQKLVIRSSIQSSKRHQMNRKSLPPQEPNQHATLAQALRSGLSSPDRNRNAANLSRSFTLSH
jgi:hypothetical protein